MSSVLINSHADHFFTSHPILVIHLSIWGSLKLGLYLNDIHCCIDVAGNQDVIVMAKIVCGMAEFPSKNVDYKHHSEGYF